MDTVAPRPYRQVWPADDPHANFKQEVADYTTHDPMPTLRVLSADTGVPVPDLIRYALVKFTASGADAMMAMTPLVFHQMKSLVDTAEAADTDTARLTAYARLRGMIEWLGWALTGPSDDGASRSRPDPETDGAD